MQIFIKPYDRTLTLDVRPSDTVAIVKGMIQHRTADMIIVGEAIPSYKMSLAYAGKPLSDHRTLEDYGIANQATLTFGINVSAKPRIRCGGPHVLCLDYPAERKAFSSDCFYEVYTANTVGYLKQLVLDKEGLIVTSIFHDPHGELRNDDVQLECILLDNAAGYRLPTLRVAHFSRRARASRTVTRLATDLLREVLSYSDLRTLAAGASTCRALLDAVPPKLAHELVVRKFPILSTIVDASTPMPPARELFESQALLFGAPPPAVVPSRGLDEYVLSLELTVDGSKHVGTGVVLDNTEAQIRFTGIPKALWDAAATIEERITANIMATRRGTLRRAALYSGDVEDVMTTVICFEWNRIPCENVAMGWISAGGGPHNVYYKPLICVEWKAPAAAAAETTELTATFKWDSDDQADDMNLEDACLMLEHWCKL